MAKPKAEYRKTEIVVEGRGRFPIDMLRYDNCNPATSTDALEIDRSFEVHGNYRIRLHRFSYDAHKAESARWRSFGWSVVEDNGVAR